MFFLLIYFVYQAGQNSRKVIPEKYSESKFLHLNAQLSQRTSGLLESQRKLAVESDAELQKRRAELQKKIFNQAVAQKIAAKKTVSVPAPVAQKPAAPPQVNTQPKLTNTATVPTPKPVTTKKPRTTVS